ncbi:MAG: hypothetical protein COZ46_05695 [Verrucomicrobia bacterium CG_4_10_14_3_um_filter_43_23]|nr:MAG: hypothetical protein AUJ82_06815 [Verrucomicrobia bacterium CG1_02_43_26]PIP58668.1 MAG: hypothetical protein COX01_07475 [Verrucomicrobia bacterium CG22_combo_CG10-13_8_21_14_all_43_17]PIX58069.1 MAG: hypothetical protein COZ46_05695 [Verrucomicrobia bacterium CG_4_10_14_3_um_filter_43_23]PIY61164.1 MAG: hypothetical protein COY94_06650 [Verrucomicrobia bacterium CG_4_10_14_0_8_um_filter_43_34]PJA43337.1 MAG: hypothetical protein CO175_08540 [Verrucomicrobia bacterium CG_4_9_14_3_um_fi
MMRKHFLIPIVVVLAFLAGCKDKPNPQPNDTVLGSTSERPDFINGADAYSQGLYARDRAFTDAYEQGVMNNPENIIASVYFGFDRSSIPEIERVKVDEVAERLWSDPNAKLLIVGRCDWRGTYEYNQALGDRRATSVEDYLKAKGVDESKIKILSKGSIDAVVDGTPEQTRRDRRSDVFIIKES